MAEDQYRRDYAQHLVEQVKMGEMTRRQLLVRSTVFGFSLTAAGSLLAACGGSETDTTSPSPTGTSAAKAGGTLRVACRDSIVAPDPITMYDQASIVVVQQIAEYLIWVNNDMTLRPVLAESWEPNEDGSVWTFNLRKDVQFNDGSPMEAADVVASLERLVVPDSGSAALSALSGILSPGGSTAVDTHTVELALEKPFADFPYLVSSSVYNSVILPRDYAGDFIKSPVGTGPFVLQQYAKKKDATLTKNPKYWQKGLPYLDGVVLKFYADPAASSLAIQAGEVDMQAETTFQGSQALFNDEKLNVVEIPGTGLRQVFMRVDKEPFTDKRVRQAIACCLDRPAIIEALFQGVGTLGNDALFASLFPGAPELPQRTQDYDKAKQLLADAGYADGISVTITPENDLENPQFAQLIAAQCEPAGIQVKLNMMPYEEYYSGDPAPWLTVPMGLNAWAPRPTPIQFVNAMNLTTSVWNSAHFSNETYDGLAEQYSATTDEASRKDIATQMATIEHDEVPQILAFFVTQLSARSKSIRDVEGASSFLDLTKAYMA